MNSRIISPWQSQLTIPEEVLLQIFIHLVDEVPLPELEAGELTFPKTQDAFVISHVCQLWRKVAVSHEYFWCDVDFTNQKLALLYLDRTTVDAPLHVTLPRAACPVEDEYQCLKQRMVHIKSLLVHTRDYMDVYSILEFFVRNPPSDNLETFHISAEEDLSCDDDGAIMHREFDSQCPPTRTHFTEEFLNLLGRMQGLRTVDSLLLDAVKIPLWSPAYDNLVNLDLFNFRPRISPIELLMALRRSPRLRTVSLLDVFSDIPPGEAVPKLDLDLDDLCELNVTSHSFRSTLYILKTIEAELLNILRVEVTSDGSGWELDEILSRREDSLLFDKIETVRLSRISDKKSDSLNTLGGVELSGYGTFSEVDAACCIRILNCTWQSQYGRSTFPTYLSSVIRVELVDDACDVVRLLDGNQIQELLLSGQIPAHVLRHLRPDRGLEEVVRLELDCSTVGKKRSAEFCLENLRMSEQIKLLRLYSYASLAAEDVEWFNHYGFQAGVKVEWAGEHTLEPLTLPYPFPKLGGAVSGKASDETVQSFKRKQEEGSSFDMTVVSPALLLMLKLRHHFQDKTPEDIQKFRSTRGRRNYRLWFLDGIGQGGTRWKWTRTFNGLGSGGKHPAWSKSG
ncbi:hypothetical protein JB92DRAFT_430379 [Gautieria morchelliformis]|nr:hypothetical protein JB92DRAFT_430379 [Gautieria morchelliformis]